MNVFTAPGQVRGSSRADPVMKYFFISSVIIAILLSVCDRAFSLTSAEVIRLKKAGVSDVTIRLMIEQEMLKAEEGKISERLTINEVIELKKNDIEDVTIRKMLEREEREEVRWKSVTRIKKRSDGKEVIVYGSSSEPPWPETKHYYFDTPGNVVLVLEEPVESDEDRAWGMLKDIRIYNKNNN